MSEHGELNQAVGKLQGLVESLERDMKNYREDKKEVYERLNAVESRLESLPTEEEWSTIKAMAKAHADKGKFWADLRRAIAVRGILGACAVAIVYFWDAIVLLLKGKMGV